MELKYYLRGLGLGIVVTAIIMGITSSKSSAMTDDEIIARAKQLGMTESRVLTDTASEENDEGEDKAESGEIQSPEENGLPEEGTHAQPEEAAERNVTGDNNPEDNVETDTVSGEPSENAPSGETAAAVPDDEETGQESQTEPETQENAKEQDVPAQEAGGEQTDGTPAVITVGSGDGSFTVSRKLEDAGIVESASDFDTFLCENGYDKKIRAGNYTISPDADDEQIARMITGQRTE